MLPRTVVIRNGKRDKIIILGLEYSHRAIWISSLAKLHERLQNNRRCGSSGATCSSGLANVLGTTIEQGSWKHIAFRVTISSTSHGMHSIYSIDDSVAVTVQRHPCTQQHGPCMRELQD